MPYCDLVKDIINVLPENPKIILTLEEEIKSGGFGMMLLDKLYKYDIVKNKVTDIIAVEDTLADKYGKCILNSLGVDAQSIVERVNIIKK